MAHGFDTVAMANERSASAGNLVWDGVEVNRNAPGGWSVPTSAQALTVTASDTTNLTNVAGTLSLSLTGAGVGIGIIVDVIVKHVEASVGNANIAVKGNATVTATSVEDAFYAAVQAAGSGGSSTFTGSNSTPQDESSSFVLAQDDHPGR